MNGEQKIKLSADIFDRKLLDKIKDEKISPRPRWHFLLKNYVVWVVGGLSLLIGAGAVSVLTYLITNNDWGVHRAIQKSWGEFFLLTLPYFWLIFLALFVFVIYCNIKHTKNGYRYPLWAVLLASILASIVLGEALFLAGVGEKIDRVMSRRAPLYERLMNPQLDFWSRPEEGRLVGVPVEFTKDGNFILIDRDQKAWEIIPASSTAARFLEKMALVEEIRLAEDMMREENMPLPPLRLLGEIISDESFSAVDVMPLLPGRAYFDRPGHGHGGGRGAQCPEKNNPGGCVVPNEGPMRSQPSFNN